MVVVSSFYACARASFTSKLLHKRLETRRQEPLAFGLDGLAIAAWGYSENTKSRHRPLTITDILMASQPLGES